MDNTDELLPRSPEEIASPSPEAFADPAESTIRITDPRVLRLVIALHEIDLWVQDQGTVSEQQFEEVVAKAILECGFTDPAEAESAIAPLLEATWPSKPGYS